MAQYSSRCGRCGDGDALAKSRLYLLEPRTGKLEPGRLPPEIDRLYEPPCRLVLRHPRTTILVAVALVIAYLALNAVFLGRERAARHGCQRHETSAAKNALRTSKVYGRGF